MWVRIRIPARVSAVTLPLDDRIAQVLMDLAHKRGVGKTFCPSEVARALSADWRPLMPDVRRVAAGLPLRVTQKGASVDIAAKGPIRLALDPAQFDNGT